MWKNGVHFIQTRLKERKKWVNDKNTEQTIISFYSKDMHTLKIHRKQDMICSTNLGTFQSNLNMLYTGLIIRYKQEL
jgi:hypothetical protein